MSDEAYLDCIQRQTYTKKSENRLLYTQSSENP